MFWLTAVFGAQLIMSCYIYKNMRPDTVWDGSFIEYLLFHSTSQSIILEETSLFLRWFACCDWLELWFSVKCKIVNHLQEGPGSALIQGHPTEGHFAEGEKSNDGSHFSFSSTSPSTVSCSPSAFISEPRCKKKKKDPQDGGRETQVNENIPYFSTEEHRSADRLWSDKVD